MKLKQYSTADLCAKDNVMRAGAMSWVHVCIDLSHHNW